MSLSKLLAELLPLKSGLIAFADNASTAPASRIILKRHKRNPYGSPRPEEGEKNVPLDTSIFAMLELQTEDREDEILPESVGVALQLEDDEFVPALVPDQGLAPGWKGYLRPITCSLKSKGVLVYLDRAEPLRHATRYCITVTARSKRGAILSPTDGSWKFTTAAAPATHRLSAALDLRAPAVHWHGGFFNGFVRVGFVDCRMFNFEDTDRLLREAHRQNPRAWNIQRDFWLTGCNGNGMDMPFMILPNVVREGETRRIASMERDDDSVLLRVEDFPGHELYGIEAGRPLAGDYHPGDKILIADGRSSVVSEVISADDTAGTVRVQGFGDPKPGWIMELARHPQENAIRDVPGSFAWSGCYLRKFDPVGTPCYYWERLDRHWDKAVKQAGRRLHANFTDAPGDTSVDGGNWSHPKDYVQYHEVIRTITDHLIGRYGDACLDFVWSIFNEPDLGNLCWRSGDWKELQRFYDYTVDAILRAFEDRGYDSANVFIGGPEMAALALELMLTPFLAHCSPRAQHEGALAFNAAFADKRLDGMRSKRVENLCRANDGKGSPCDFVSVHNYCSSEDMAKKFKLAKDIALRLDAEYFEKLWIDGFESCPEWYPTPDLAVSDSYLGNGYFSTWCADVARRQLQTAAADSRYAYGETILTIWPWPTPNFAATVGVARAIHVDDDGDGKPDRSVTVPSQVFHFINLLSSMGDHYWPLPDWTVDGHIVSGFASRSSSSSHAGQDLRILLYSHDGMDVQSRCRSTFLVTLNLEGYARNNAKATEYRFDSAHNSYYAAGCRMRDRAKNLFEDPMAGYDRTLDITRKLSSNDPKLQLEAFRAMNDLDWDDTLLVLPLFDLLNLKDPEVRLADHFMTWERCYEPKECYRPEEAEEIQRLAELRPTRETELVSNADGAMRLEVELQGNGVSFLVIQGI